MHITAYMYDCVVQLRSSDLSQNENTESAVGDFDKYVVIVHA